MISAIALASCVVNIGHIIEANDNIVTKEYQLTAFDEVAMRCVGNVVLIQSDTINGMVELTAPDNYIDLYKFESNEGKLDIDFIKNNINIHTENVKIKVYANKLTKVENSGAATMSTDSLLTDRLEVSNSGVGTFKLQKVTANDVTIRCSGVGSIMVDGQCSNADLSCSGVGSIEANDLKAKNTKAKVSGVGSISCYASEKLQGKVSGIGSLKYAGNPKNVEKKESGTGKITPL